MRLIGACLHNTILQRLAVDRVHHLDHVTDYVRTCNCANVPVTFNIDIDRTSALSQESLALPANVKKNPA